MSDRCETCNRPENFPADPGSELRPYGAGGSAICYRCAFATPKDADRTQANFLTLSAAEIAATGTHVIGGES